MVHMSACSLDFSGVRRWPPSASAPLTPLPDAGVRCHLPHATYRCQSCVCDATPVLSPTVQRPPTPCHQCYAPLPPLAERTAHSRAAVPSAHAHSSGHHLQDAANTSPPLCPTCCPPHRELVSPSTIAINSNSTMAGRYATPPPQMPPKTGMGKAHDPAPPHPFTGEPSSSPESHFSPSSVKSAARLPRRRIRHLR
jgi:hypothetical protein